MYEVPVGAPLYNTDGFEKFGIFGQAPAAQEYAITVRKPRTRSLYAKDTESSGVDAPSSERVLRAQVVAHLVGRRVSGQAEDVGDAVGGERLAG